MVNNELISIAIFFSTQNATFLKPPTSFIKLLIFVNKKLLTNKIVIFTSVVCVFTDHTAKLINYGNKKLRPIYHTTDESP